MSKEVGDLQLCFAIGKSDWLAGAELKIVVGWGQWEDITVPAQAAWEYHGIEHDGHSWEVSHHNCLGERLSQCF